MNARTGWRHSALFWTVLALLAGAAVLWWALQPKAKSDPPAAVQRPALTISSALPARTLLPRTLSAQGDMAAWQEASVGTESNGLKLDAVLVNVGDVVRRGQVLAPDDGVISARSATVGAVVGAGTELFRLVRQGRLEWRAEVLASDLPLLAPGTRARVTAASGAVVEGTVRKTGPTVNPETRKLLVYVDVPAMARTTAGGQAGGQPLVLPGMFARGDFLLAESAALTVPQEAVVVRDGFSYVFAVGADQRVQLRKVQVGRRVGEQVEVLGGLDAQQPVAVQGAGLLNDGDLVRVVPGTADSMPKQAPALASQAPAAIK